MGTFTEHGVTWTERYNSFSTTIAKIFDIRVEGSERAYRITICERQLSKRYSDAVEARRAAIDFLAARCSQVISERTK